MSWELVKKALNAKVGSDRGKLLLIALANFANKNEGGRAYPSITTLCDLIEMKHRTAQRHLKRLEEDGHISIKRRMDSSNLYTLHLPDSKANANLAVPQCQTGVSGGVSLADGGVKMANEPLTEPPSEPLTSLTKKSNHQKVSEWELCDEICAICKRLNVLPKSAFSDFKEYNDGKGKDRFLDKVKTFELWVAQPKNRDRHLDTSRKGEKKLFNEEEWAKLSEFQQEHFMLNRPDANPHHRAEIALALKAKNEKQTAKPVGANG